MDNSSVAKGHKAIDKSTRTLVIRKHKHKGSCPICKKREFPFVFDHIYPKSRGGSDKHTNLRLICKMCNALKSDRIISDNNLRKLVEVYKNE